MPSTDKTSDRNLAEALRALSSDSFVYLVGAAMLGLASFALVPLYTRRLTAVQFGTYALIDVTVLILVAVSQLKLDVAYLRDFASIDAARRGELLGSVLVLGSIVATLSGLALAVALSSPLGRSWSVGASPGVAWTLPPIIIFEVVQSFLLSDLRARRRAVPYCSATVLRLVAMVAATLWFLVVQHEGLLGVFLGRVVGDLVAGVFLLWFCLRGVKVRIIPKLLVPMLRFGVPLTWAGLMVLSLDATGRYFLLHFSSLEQVGYYGAAIKVSGIFQMLVVQPFVIAWGALMFQVANWPNAKMVYSRVLSYASVVALAVAIGLAITSPTLIRMLAGRAYAPALIVLPLILLVRAFNVLEHPAAIGIYVAGRTKWFAALYTLGLIVNLIANYFLVRRFGFVGSAWAWLLGWVVTCGTILTIGQKLYPIRFKWGLFSLAAAAWVPLIIAPRETARLFQALSVPAQVGAAIAVMGLAAAVLVLDFRRSAGALPDEVPQAPSVSDSSIIYSYAKDPDL